jgi:hypothetical protein
MSNPYHREEEGFWFQALSFSKVMAFAGSPTFNSGSCRPKEMWGIESYE